MKIAIVHPRFGALGGGSVAMRDVVEGLAACGDSVTVYTREWRGDAPPGVRVELIDPPYVGSVMRDWTFERAVRRMILGAKRKDYALVVSDQKIAGIDIYIAGGGVHVEWTRRKLRNASWWQRALGRIQPQNLYITATEKRMFGSKDLRAVVCVSETVRRDVLQHFAIDPERVHVIYNGVDLTRFDHAFRLAHRTALRTEMKLQDKCVLLFIGGGMLNKGIHQTLEAASRCGLDFELLVVGNDKRLGEFRELARSLGIASRCRFLGAQADVRPFYTVADIFVMPSRFETFGLVYLEAVAMGVPVLVSSAAGACELIEEGKHGYRIEPDDTADIAFKMQRLSQTAASMESDCVALARRYSRESMAARLHELLSRLA